MFNIVKSLFTMQTHPSAGENATALRLLRQGVPYLLNRKGFSLPPLSIFFIINSQCNMKCQMCDVGRDYKESMFYKNLIGDRHGETGDFPIERFETLLDEVKSFSPFISITSTEPLLYQPLPRAIAAVKSRSMGINVTTNGLLLSRRADALFESGLDSLTISLDGPPDVHDRIRGVTGAFDKVMEGIQAIAARKRAKPSSRPRLSINTVLTNLNAGSLERLVDALPLSEIDGLTFALMTFCPQSLADRHNAAWGDRYPASRTCLEGECDPTRINVQALHGELERIKAKLGGKLHFFFKNDPKFLHTYLHRPETFMDFRPCLFPWFTAQITASGDLIGVTRCFPKVYGNILETPFQEAWNGPQMRRFRMDLQRHWRFPACTRCEGVLY